MKRTFALGTLLSLLVLAGAPAADASHSWGSYHWARTTNPFTLKLGDNVTSAWDPYLATTSADWSKSSVLDTTIVPGNTTGRKCRPTAGRIEVCNAKYGKNGWLGVAQIWIKGSHITQATTRVNDTYFNTAKYNTPVWRNHVLCQEVGHDFGLDHQDESGADLGTCMDYSTNPINSQHPNQHDYDQLALIYSHTDSTSTVESQQAGNGSVSRHIRRTGDTTAVITFIYWA